MQVQLYVYDLSRGMARLMSKGLTGIQIDAIYHTSLVFGNVEYFFGAGVQTCYPGSTHHGQPMEIVAMGKTELPLDDILEYLESLKEIYTHESYDLFAHNCNNFTQDFSMFLVGKGIPEHITSLPQTVLNTPFGQMLKPQIDASMRSITQAAVPPEKNPTIQAERAAQNKGKTVSNGTAAKPHATNAQNKIKAEAASSAASASSHAATLKPTNTHDATDKKHPKKLEVRSTTPEPHKAAANGGTHGDHHKKHPKKLEVRSHGTVYNVTEDSVLNSYLTKDTCAVVFFTSSTCGPCRMAYPTFDTLAAENPKVSFIKVDINQAHALAQKYSIRVTPTFKTFVHGQKEDEWTGAMPATLRTNVELMIEKHLGHPHLRLKMPILQYGSLKPITYAKIPPLDKLTAKMGDKAKDPAVTALKDFLTIRSAEGSKEAPLPDMPACARFLRNAPNNLPLDSLFTAYDLLRCALPDPRVSGWFAEESAPGDSETISFLLSHVLSHIESDTCPYNLRLVTIQLACNLFSTPLFTKTIFHVAKQNTVQSHIPVLLSGLATSSLLASPDKPALRAAAGNLAFNLASAIYRIRREDDREALAEVEQVALLASLLEMLTTEKELTETMKPAVLACGYVIYCAPRDGEIKDLCVAMGVGEALGKVKAAKEIERVVAEVVELAGKW